LRLCAFFVRRFSSGSSVAADDLAATCAREVRTRQQAGTRRALQQFTGLMLLAATRMSTSPAAGQGRPLCPS
jgi:hypothetical protein